MAAGEYGIVDLADCLDFKVFASWRSIKSIDEHWNAEALDSVGCTDVRI